MELRLLQNLFIGLTQALVTLLVSFFGNIAMIGLPVIFIYGLFIFDSIQLTAR
jgi:hypothetical protein